MGALLEAARQGDVDVVMGYSLTRLGRWAKDLADFPRPMMPHWHDQNPDTSTPASQVLDAIKAAMAQTEAEQTSERVPSHHRLTAAAGPFTWRRGRPVRAVQSGVITP